MTFTFPERYRIFVSQILENEKNNRTYRISRIALHQRGPSPITQHQEPGCIDGLPV